MQRIRIVLGLALVVAGTAVPLAGQRISLAPDIGVYVPTAQLVSATTTGSTTELMEQRISVSLGGKLDIWLTNRVGIQGTGTYAPSRLSVSASGLSAQEDANIFLGSGRLMFYVTPRQSPISLLLNGGIGMVNRSGEAYAGVEDKTDLSGTFGAAVGFRLGSILSLRVTGESYIYNPDFLAQTLADVATQNDFNLSLGLGIPLMGGAGSSAGN